MAPHILDDEDPDRLYTITRGRSRVDDRQLDLVTLVVAKAEATPGMQSEYVKILRLCFAPTSVVEISAELRLPVSVARILVSDLLRDDLVTVRHPSTGRAQLQLPDVAFLKKVLVGLQNI
ncbi:DUF742 domain-containing protein [Amycolatopsis rhizosphaerae]|uniref:DUF742 domain-containing protein n=1 Tax=Amycolatopsis rhizosphaerae TaxID=2053003 RepID=A0A558BIJ9_9PSEU|nr:DUF742 domain-containing protein [Amycolatopsis rhizosphaerae]TVT36347.1 DUF742 domain-containing protein [Amycolatopsis rhizosphaerae]